MSGPEFLRRAVHAAVSRSQEAYRSYVTHCGTCPGCEGKARCTEADDLWQAYQVERNAGDQG